MIINLKRYFSPLFYRDKIKKYGIKKSIKIAVHRIFVILTSFSIQHVINPFIHISERLMPFHIQKKTLYAFYDLKKSPATFDVVVFLIFAELSRQKKALDNIHIIIVPGDENGFRKKDLDSYNNTNTLSITIGIEYMQWRLWNILIPACNLLPSCKGITVSNSRSEAFNMWKLCKHIFPINYSLSTPVSEYLILKMNQLMPNKLTAFLVPPDEALKHIMDWKKNNLNGQMLITITLRECAYELDRNSSLKEWANFARNLDKEKYYPVFLRDCESAFKPPPVELVGLNIFPEVIWNMSLRSAIYQLADLNLFVSCGCFEVCNFLQGSRYLRFKVITNTLSGEAMEEHLKSINIYKGSQFSFSNNFQKTIWEDDNLEVIEREFYSMVDKIEKSRRG